MSTTGSANAVAPGFTDPAVRVTRSRQSTVWAAVVAVVVVAVLGYLPYLVYSGTTSLLVNVFILMIMATMWNLLAGYAGLVSVGQQGFIGIGAYAVVLFAQHGMDVFVALPLAMIISGVVGIPVWWLLRRLRTAYFAIASWVVASVLAAIVTSISSLGSGTGISLLPYLNFSATLLSAYTYWAALIVLVAALAAGYLLLRSRSGLVLTAVRDDEIAARSAGGRVGRVQRMVFVVAAIGCGGAGALLAISQIFVQGSNVFNVSWSAEMIFAVIIGGIGSIEGPIIGAIIYYAIYETLGNYGTWYFIVLGVIAMAVAIWARRGLWGLVADRFNLRIFPVGYYLWPRASAVAVSPAAVPAPGIPVVPGPVPGTPVPPAAPSPAAPSPAPPPTAGEELSADGG
jgi:branched-chain amino acid transport system permease protein